MWRGIFPNNSIVITLNQLRSICIRFFRWVFLIVIVCTAFFLGSVARGHFPDLTSYLTSVSTVITSLTSILMLVAAVVALNNWRKQVREDLVIKTLTDLEDTVTLLFIAFLEPSGKLKQNTKLTELYKKSIILCFRLRRRGYWVDHTKDLEVCISNVINSLRDSGEVPAEVNNAMLTALNKLTEESNNVL